MHLKNVRYKKIQYAIHTCIRYHRTRTKIMDFMSLSREYVDGAWVIQVLTQKLTGDLVLKNIVESVLVNSISIS